MAMMTQSAAPAATAKKKVSFWESQRLAKQRAYEKQSKKKKIKLAELTMFTQQLAAMLEAGLPLVSALDALQEQTENPVFRIIIRDVKNDVSSGTAFSEACRKFPKAFPNLFTSMVEAGEASGALSDILDKVAVYFADTVALNKKVKGAMVYPAAVIGISIICVAILLTQVIPVFAEMFESFGSELPKPTQMLIDVSEFAQAYIIHMIIGVIVLSFLWKKGTATPKGRRFKDVLFSKLPIVGNLTRKINISRFCRTYGILLKSGVPILRSLEICSTASNNTFIEKACSDITRHISQGGQLSEIVAVNPYFPPMVRHMARAGEQTGNVDGMMNNIADFYDLEVKNIVDSLTSLLQPFIIVFLGVVIGSIVTAMFLPIFNLAGTIN